MQALPCQSAGTMAIRDAGKATFLHQQSTANEPAAEAAHWFGCPHNGQFGACSGTGLGRGVAMAQPVFLNPAATPLIDR